MGEDPEFRFGLPPSLGREPVFEMAREFADLLFAARFTTVVPYPSYEELQRGLFEGEVDAAWGPPLICARVEAAGGTVAQRAIRDGTVTYRSGLVTRAQDRWDLDLLKSGGFRPRAVWVDEWSMAGYVLPRALLRREGVVLEEAMVSERNLGSYTACFDALRSFDADLTASFVSQRGLSAAWGDRARRLHVIAESDDTPNDGIVLAPNLAADRKARLVENLEQLLANDQARPILCAQFAVDGFDRPPPGCYAPLNQLG